MIIDVREVEEFQQEHVPGSINIPLSNFTPSSFLPYLKEQEKIILICRTNRRSNLMKQILLKAQLARENQIFVYEPGVLGWIQQGKPKIS